MTGATSKLILYQESANICISDTSNMTLWSYKHCLPLWVVHLAPGSLTQLDDMRFQNQVVHLPSGMVAWGMLGGAARIAFNDTHTDGV